ncbi:MAG: protein-glutamine gamma-glutamyltransferase [Solirubrobacteraceae bacterium]|jgi:transglutaminase-like putative cysteine protease|nr:protein-glutamine gamma-glutamyltransferase [Solirubrobacteraceae bacterium]
MSVAAAAPRGRVRPALPPLTARGVAFAALCGFGLIHWMLMVQPAEPARALAGVVLALGYVAGVDLRPRSIAFFAGVALAVAGYVAGGVSVADLWPTHWGDVFSSIASGISSVGGARIPYAGSDPDLQLVIPLGGIMLALVAGILSQHRVASLTALVTLYAVPAIALDLRGEFLRGAVLAVLVLLYLRLERVAQRELAAAAGLAAAAAVVALAAAPALDTRRPWFDYEEFAQKTATTRTVEFHWDHDYAALPWPRDGREMLRVKAPRPFYWRVDTLDLFDGFRWRENPTPGAPPDAIAQNVGVSQANLKRWTFPIAVSVRGLRSPTLALTGITESVTMPGRDAAIVAPGVWGVGRPIRRADSYSARVYVPEPSRAQLGGPAPVDYPQGILEDLPVRAIGGDGGTDPIETLTRRFGFPAELVSYGTRPATPALRRSNLRRVFALSQRLLRGAPTPYAYVRAVQRYLADGFTYDETPPRAARTLDGFLFDAKSGFCQQYSGAMALLLRMGGVPARVASGFAPGSYDEDAKRYIVRDLDAHSWVEAWFDGIGWVVFDPTPSSAPPRSQALGSAASAGNGDIRDRGTQVLGTRVPQRDSAWAELVLGALGVVVLLGAARLLWLRRAAALPMSELERALRGAGETCAPGTTLSALEARLPGGADYLRALRAERYERTPPTPGPTPAQRRSLRRALTHGRGPVARSRTWLALPPRLK